MAWLKTEPILAFFQEPKNEKIGLTSFNNYKDFVESYDQEPEEILGNLTIEKD